MFLIKQLNTSKNTIFGAKLSRASQLLAPPRNNEEGRKHRSRVIESPRTCSRSKRHVALTWRRGAVNGPRHFPSSPLEIRIRFQQRILTAAAAQPPSRSSSGPRRAREMAAAGLSYVAVLFISEEEFRCFFWSGEGERKEASRGLRDRSVDRSMRSELRGGMEPCATWLGDLGSWSIDPAHGGARAGICSTKRTRRAEADDCTGVQRCGDAWDRPRTGWTGSMERFTGAVSSYSEGLNSFTMAVEGGCTGPACCSRLGV
jgi:hypothetical protein